MITDMATIVRCEICSWEGSKDNLNIDDSSAQIDHSNGVIKINRGNPRCPICNSDRITNSDNQHI